MRKTIRILVVLGAALLAAGATARAGTIDPDLNNEIYTINGASGAAIVTGNSVLAGTVTINQGFFVEYLVVGGGGGGGNTHGGGGGAGGYLEGTSYQVSVQPYTVKVGNGGAGAVYPGGDNTYAANGGNSQFSMTVAYGGGGGAGRNYVGTLPNGGSGGGNADSNRDVGNPIDPAQGNNGGQSGQGSKGGGGGGAGAVGGSATGSVGGTGGIGKSSSITGFATDYAGGGGGGVQTGTGGSASYGGGIGGRTFVTPSQGENGGSNTGGGGGGGAAWDSGNQYRTGGNGGSGIVVVRYEGAPAATGGTIAENPGSATGYTVHSFTTVGTTAFDMSAVNLNARLGATLTGDLSGAGSLIYGGPGKLTLAGNNSYGGSTTVNAGTLALGSSASLPSSVIAVNGAGVLDVTAVSGGYTLGAGETLKGSGGTVTGDVTATGASGNPATVAPGNSIGTLNFVGTLVLGNDSDLILEVGAGGQNDRINVTGDLDLISGSDRLDLLAVGGWGGSYTLATWTGALTGQFSSVYFDGALMPNPTAGGGINGSYQLIYDIGGKQLLLIPEPTALALLAATLTAAVRRRGRPAAA